MFVGLVVVPSRNIFAPNKGKSAFENYRRETQSHIRKNIDYLAKRGFLFSEYPCHALVVQL